MPIKFEKLYTEELLEENPTWLFVFGDNYEQKGKGGQAKVCRDKSNVIGIPTKKAPNNLPSSFLSNEDFSEWCAVVEPILFQLEKELKEGKVVVFPTDGIGTGLARLPEKAPKLSNSLNIHIGNLVYRFGLTK